MKRSNNSNEYNNHHTQFRPLDFLTPRFKFGERESEINGQCTFVLSLRIHQPLISTELLEKNTHVSQILIYKVILLQKPINDDSHITPYSYSPFYFSSCIEKKQRTTTFIIIIIIIIILLPTPLKLLPTPFKFSAILKLIKYKNIS